MKKRITKAISLLCVLSIMGSFCGCTVRTSNGGNRNVNQNKDGGVIDYSNLSQKDGTAVYTYKYKDPDGKEKTDEVQIDFDETDKLEIGSTGDLKDKRFLSSFAEKDYHMTKEKAEEAVSDSADFQEFTVVEYIQNKSNKAMAFKSLKVDYNGKQDLWINTSLGAEIAIVPGSVYPVFISGIADMSKYDEKALQEAFKDVRIQLEYTLTESTNDDVDWDNIQLKTMDIH